MIAFAVLTGALSKLGVIAIAAVAAAALLVKDDRLRAGAILGALVLAPVLLLAEIWHSPQLSAVHRHPLAAAVGAVLALLALGGAAALLAPRMRWLGLLAVVALPFRVPIQAGGTTSNLLVPLYFVVAAGSLAFVVPALMRGAGGEDAPRGLQDATRERVRAAGWMERLLAVYLVLYALQSVYSPAFEKALQQLVFFYVPFTLLYCLLWRLEWTPKLLRQCLVAVVYLGVLFAVVGFVEYGTKTLFLNPKLIAANDVHAYFTVNSVFFDPDIFGRFLALVMILLAALLLYARPRREQLAAIGVLAILWGGLVLTLSRSSMGALLVGLGMLAAIRWNARRTLVIAATVVAVGAVAVAASPTTFGLNQGLNGVSSGRADLVTGGISLFGDRPLWGYGSGSFVHEYQAHHPGSPGTLSASHTMPITIAAEQGLLGEVVYVVFVVAVLQRLLAAARDDPARIAIAAAFAALVFHTLLYADFLEDPVTWTLLGIGTATAVAAPPIRRVRARRRAAPSPVAA